MPPRQRPQTAAAAANGRSGGAKSAAPGTSGDKRPAQGKADEEPAKSTEAPPQEEAEAAKQPPPKRVKKELPALDSPTPARAVRGDAPTIQATTEEPDAREEPPPKRLRGAAPAASSSAPGSTVEAEVPRSANTRSAGANLVEGTSASSGSASIVWALSTVKSEILEVSAGMDDIPADLRELPECVLVGGVAAKRELVAALLGQHIHSTAIAAMLIDPAMRQPMAVELRGSSQAVPVQGPEADKWLRSVNQAVQAGLGNRLKAEPLMMRLSLPGCANIDIIDLPERSTASGGTHPRVEEMRARYLGSASSMLVCLEPGAPAELCRRFDPRMQRTVFLGAAASSGTGDVVPASTLCGASAAKDLEERFVAMCTQRLHLWLAGLASVDLRLSKMHAEVNRTCEEESNGFLLRRARDVGISFGRAFQHVISGTPGCDAGALTLEEELAEFAVAASRLECGIGQWLSPEGAAAAAASVWSGFGSVQAYTQYLKTVVGIPGADLPLNGGAAWQRLLLEIEVAMRLARPTREELAGLHLASVQAGGTGVRGHQLWDDVFEKLLRELAFDPLRRRVRYVAARVCWAMRQQKIAVADWMATLEDGKGRQANAYARQFSPLFPQHLAVLRSSALTRDLVFGAHDMASEKVASQLLRDIEGTLTAGCINPSVMMRPGTQPDFQPPPPPLARPGEDAAAVPSSAASTGSSGGKASETRQRVKTEMLRRSGRSGGLPVVLQHRVYDSKEALVALPSVELQLRSAFMRLTGALSHQVYAFADTALNSLSRVHLDEAINLIHFSPEQCRAIAKRQNEALVEVKQVEKRMVAVRRCVQALRGAAGLGIRA